MLDLNDAVARVLADVPAMPAETVPLADALDRVVATPIVAALDVPPHDNSAMDGFAVRAADLGPGVTLARVAAIAAGEVWAGTLGAGEAARIFTGAPIPAGADTVVIQEDTSWTDDTVTVRGPARVGANIRRRGDDVQAGQVLVDAGVRVTPGRLGLLASQGLTEVAVARRPVIALLATGDELVPPGRPLGPGQIHASTAVALAGLVRHAGGQPRDHGIAPDRMDALVEALRAAARGADAVVTTGGVSVGEHDLVKDAFAALGGAVEFWKVAIKPGKPLAWGYLQVDGREVPLFGLPGNPVSAMVNARQVVWPWIRMAIGMTRPYLPVIEAVAGARLRARAGRAKLLRVVLSREDGVFVARSTGSQSSGVLSSVARAHGLALVPPGVSGPDTGDPVRVQLLDPSFLDGAEPGYGW